MGLLFQGQKPLRAKEYAESDGFGARKPRVVRSDPARRGGEGSRSIARPPPDTHRSLRKPRIAGENGGATSPIKSSSRPQGREPTPYSYRLTLPGRGIIRCFRAEARFPQPCRQTNPFVLNGARRQRSLAARKAKEPIPACAGIGSFVLCSSGFRYHSTLRQLEKGKMTHLALPRIIDLLSGPTLSARLS